MRRTRQFTLAVVMVVALGSCGSADDGESVSSPAPETADSRGADSTDSEADGNPSDADASAMPSEGELPSSVPADFPIAIPAGWEIDFNAEIGLTVSSTRLFYAADRYDEIVAFYDEWTAEQPDEYQRVETATGATFTRVASPPYLITIGRDHAERGQTWTLLQASGAAG